jgi:RecB family exonuclease
MARPSFIYVSPTRRKNREIEARLRSKLLTWKALFVTPSKMAELIVKEAYGDHYADLTEDLRNLFITEILSTAAGAGELTFFRFDDGSVPVGTARHIGRSLEVLARRKIKPKDPESGIRPAAVKDMTLIHKRLAATLSDHGLMDPSYLLQTAESLFVAGSAVLPYETDLIMLDGITAPERAEADFLVALCRADDRQHIVVTLLEDVAEHIARSGWEALPPNMSIYGHGRRFFELIGVPWPSHSQSSPSEINSPVPAPLREHPDRALEVKGIARAIKDLFASIEEHTEPLAPEDVHVAVPKLDHYYRLFIEIFPRYGIPFNITRGIPLSSIPVAGLLLSLLNAILKRDLESLYAFFSSDLVSVPSPDSPLGTETVTGQSETESPDAFVTEHRAAVFSHPDSPEETSQPDLQSDGLDIASLDRLCRKAYIRGGDDPDADWLRPLIGYYRASLERIRQDEDTESEKALRTLLDQDLTQLWLLFRELTCFRQLSEPARPTELVTRFLDLLKRYEVHRNLTAALVSSEVPWPVGKRIMMEKNIKGFNRAVELISECAYDLERAGEPQTDMGTLRDLFLDRCRREMIQEAGELAGVSISEVLELRNMAKPVVFLAGLTADDFPLSPAGNFLMPSGPETAAFSRAFDESLFILDQTLRSSGQVSLSFPRSDGSDPLEPSPFPEDLQREGRVERVPDDEGDEDPRCPAEIVEQIGSALSADGSVQWDLVLRLLSQHPAVGSSQQDVFYHDIRGALTAAIERDRPDSFGPYDGILSDEQVAAMVRDHVTSRRFAYSASDLKLYQDCPLRYFFTKILRLEPIEQIPEEADAAIIGTVVHEILAEFFKSARHKNDPRISSGNFLDSTVGLWETSCAVLARYPQLSEHTPDGWADRVRITSGLYSRDELKDNGFSEQVRSGTDMPVHKRGILRRFADHEARLDLNVIPSLFEAAFGMDGNPPLLIPRADGTPIRIRGRIDRVDLLKDSADTDTPRALVIDYKTGKVPTATDVKSGKDMQLQVYMLAASELMPNLGAQAVGGWFLELQSKRSSEDTAGRDLRRGLIITDEIDPDMVRASSLKPWIVSSEDLEQWRKDIRSVDEQICGGQFPRAQDQKACFQCEYRMACFRDHYRIRLIGELEDAG